MDRFLNIVRVTLLKQALSCALCSVKERGEGSLNLLGVERSKPVPLSVCHETAIKIINEDPFKMARALQKHCSTAEL